MNEDPTQRRTRHTVEFLQARLATLVRFDIYPIEDWAGSINGWNPPRLYDGLFVWAVCPALIAANTADEFVDEADKYLLAVVSLVALYITHIALPPDERRVRVESDFYDRYPGSMSLVSTVELATLSAAS